MMKDGKKKPIEKNAYYILRDTPRLALELRI